MFSYRYLLKQAWKITREHKYLWFFGLFASLAAASGSIEYQVISQNLHQSLLSSSSSQLGSLLLLGVTIKKFFIGLGILFSQNIWVILNALTLLIVTFTLVASFVWLAITSQAALVYDVKKILGAKKKIPNLSLRGGLTAGHKHFWPVFGLNILIRIVTTLALFIISLPLVFMLLGHTSSLMIIYIIFFIIMIPVAVSFALMIKYAIAYNVLDKEPFGSSLKKAWNLFIKNWLISLEMAVILFIINFIFGVVALLIISFIFFPLFLVGILFSSTWLILLMLFLGLVTIVIIGSLLTTFQITTWTSLFLVLKAGGGEAKLERIFRKK